MASNLTVSQSSELRLLEQQIATGVESARQAFLKIQERNLYLEYGTFEKYCKERWGFSSKRGYQLLAEAETQNRVAKDLEIPPLCASECQQGGDTPIPTRTAHLRELAKAPPEKQAEAWTTAVESSPDRHPTQADVKQAIAELVEEEPPTTESRMKAFNSYLESLARELKAIGDRAAAIGNPHLMLTRHNILIGQLNAAATTIRAAKGKSACNKCPEEKPTMKCQRCHGTGWMDTATAHMYT